MQSDTPVAPKLIEHYMMRLASYQQFPSQCTLSRIKAAHTGLYYSGDRDLVVCFFCGIRILKWEETIDPQMAHQKFSPQCTTAYATIPVNVLSDDATSSSPVVNREMFEEAQERSNEPDALTTYVRNTLHTVTAMIDLDAPDETDTRVTGANCVMNITMSDSCDSGTDNRNSRQKPHYLYWISNTHIRSERDAKRHIEQNTNAHGPSRPLLYTGEVNTDTAAMRDEQNRLATFVTWLRNAIIARRDVACAGMYYLNEYDRVRCAFCYKLFGTWHNTRTLQTVTLSKRSG